MSTSASLFSGVAFSVVVADEHDESDELELDDRDEDEEESEPRLLRLSLPFERGELGSVDFFVFSGGADVGIGEGEREEDDEGRRSWVTSWSRWR